MQIPIGFHDINILLAILAIILLATSELINPYYGQTGLVIDKGRLRRVSLILGLLFLSTVALRVYQIFITT